MMKKLIENGIAQGHMLLMIAMLAAAVCLFLLLSPITIATPALPPAPSKLQCLILFLAPGLYGDPVGVRVNFWLKKCLTGNGKIRSNSCSYEPHVSDFSDMCYK